jgi:hypothetical protein
MTRKRVIKFMRYEEVKEIKGCTTPKRDPRVSGREPVSGLSGSPGYPYVKGCTCLSGFQVLRVYLALQEI